MIPESDEVRDEAYWRAKPFVWVWPRPTIYTPADKRPRALLNRYPHNVIGAAVVAFGRCWGITWKASQRRPRSTRKQWWIRATYITTGHPWVTTDELDRPARDKIAAMWREGLSSGWVARAREILL